MRTQVHALCMQMYPDPACSLSSKCVNSGPVCPHITCELNGEVAADGGAERARGAGDLHVDLATV